VLFGDLNFWNVLTVLGVPLIILVALGFGMVLIIRKGVKGSGISNKAMHAELVRIDGRLTAIEKMLKDID